MIIKEFCEDGRTAVIRENNYGSGLDKFMRLFEEAQKDFPGLLYENVSVVKYGGRRYKGTFGIEFETSSAPNSYIRINALEYTS